MSSKFVLSKKVREWLDSQDHNRKNLYTCSVCGKTVVTYDVDKGVTPFMIACRATNKCKGSMVSSFYTCDQSLPATFEFYRPETLKGLDIDTIEHCRKGGLLLRPKKE